MISKTIIYQNLKMIKMQLVDGSNRGKTKVFTFSESHKNLWLDLMEIVVVEIV